MQSGQPFHIICPDPAPTFLDQVTCPTPCPRRYLSFRLAMNSPVAKPATPSRPWNPSTATAVLLVLTILALSPVSTRPPSGDDSEGWTDSSLAIRVVVAMSVAAREWTNPSSARGFDALLNQAPIDRLPAAPFVAAASSFAGPPPRGLDVSEHLLDLPPPTA